MQLPIKSVLVSLAFFSISANAVACSEAVRFGEATVTPANPKVGDTLNIQVDFTCAVQNSGNVPLFVDYTLEVLPANNNGFESPIILGRHTLSPGALSDNLTATIPNALFKGAPYSLIITNIHSQKDADGRPFLTAGEFGPIGPIISSS
ncbi:hypothetical protein D9613_007354 [Agrocybe pediades]|uniref:Uncharacterized protein n=1 Tax=Agrocybe pediades TaxID=84607 RepID=A0A8H4VK15_9AGAR|nr:hypothetical protein D9613_007354 [Agrocybe pediades]